MIWEEMVEKVKNKSLVIEVNRDIVFEIISHSSIYDLPLRKIKLINYISWFTTFLMSLGLITIVVWAITDYFNGYGLYCLGLYVCGYIIFGILKTYATTLVEEKILENEDYYKYVYSLKSDLKKEPIRFLNVKLNKN